MKFAMAIALILIPCAAFADYDDGGIDLTPVDPVDDPGEVCGECYNSAAVIGLAFQGGTMYGTTNGGAVYMFDGCDPVFHVQLAGIGSYVFGLGWDHNRDLWIAADPSSDIITAHDVNGALVNSIYVGGGPVGAAYDSGNDLYWWCDWTNNMMYSINPDFTPGPSFGVPAGTRISGVGYDMANHALIYNGRDQGMGYWVDADTYALIDDFMCPNYSSNGGNGTGVNQTNTNVWIQNWDDGYLYCIEGLGGGTPVLETTWGNVKGLYNK
jgi:hypothetical protein